MAKDTLLPTIKKRDFERRYDIAVNNALFEIRLEKKAIVEKYDNTTVVRERIQMRRQIASINGRIGAIGRILRKQMEVDEGYQYLPDFMIQIASKHLIYLVDKDNGWATITNSVEAVLYELYLKKYLFGQRLFYKDTDGMIDEIVYRMTENRPIFERFEIGCNVPIILELEKDAI